MGYEFKIDKITFIKSLNFKDILFFKFISCHSFTLFAKSLFLEIKIPPLKVVGILSKLVLVIPTSPKFPVSIFLIFELKDCAQSSINNKLCFSQIFFIFSISQG